MSLNAQSTSRTGSAKTRRTSQFHDRGLARAPEVPGQDPPAHHEVGRPGDGQEVLEVAGSSCRSASVSSTQGICAAAMPARSASP